MIRANGSEILALAPAEEDAAGGKGVDSTQGSEAALGAAKRLVAKYSKGLIKGIPPLINHTPLPSDALRGPQTPSKRGRILQDPLSSTPPGQRPSAAAPSLESFSLEMVLR